MFVFFGPYWAIFGVGVGSKNCFGVSSYRLIIFCFLSITLFLLYHLVLRLCGGGCRWLVVGGGSQRLLSLNPTIVLLLGLWLLCWAVTI